LPFRVLYIFSDLAYHIIRLIGYRRAVINENLSYSFPEKNADWIRKTRLQFYQHFCDLIVETIKLQTISKKEMKRRIIFTNIDYIKEIGDKGKDVTVVMGHYGNWEWITAFSLQSDILLCDVYRPLKNKVFDKHMLKIRGRWGNKNVPMRDTLKEVIKLKKNNQRYALGLIADQSPGKYEIQYWTHFMNQNTAVLLGPEKIAKITKTPVAYAHISKPRRGYYEVEFIPIIEDPNASAEYEITEKHVRLLEESIRKEPQYWLWSHKRWKYSEERVHKHS